MRLPWTLVSLTAIASSIPLAISHELHLLYLPSLTQNDQGGSYLSLKWSIVNGTLYANDDPVFPPSMSMQLHASQWDSQSKQLFDQSEVEVTYALEARPLSSNENSSPSRIVRVRVNLLGPEGKAVSPNAVLLDLLEKPDGSHHIARVRMEPTKSHSKVQSHRNRPWQMKFWQTQLGLLVKQSQNNQAISSSSLSEHNVKSAVPNRKPADVSSDEAADAQPGFIFSPYWSPTDARPSHRHASHDPSRTFMRMVRPIILPALLGAAAGLVACLLGFVIGHLFMSVSARLGLRKQRNRHRWSRMVSLETGSGCEKEEPGPQIYLELA